MISSLREQIEAELLAYGEAQGWVLEGDVGAHIETWLGSHIWQNEGAISEEALRHVLGTHVERYLQRHSILPPEAALACDGFEDQPSLERLIAAVEALEGKEAP